MDYLNRAQAPFSAEIWKEIDEAATSAAAERLTGRRFLDVEGPFGVGLTSIEVGNDGYCRQPQPDEAGAIMGRAIPVPMLRKSFRLSIRRLAAHLENAQPLDLAPAQDAAEAVADREEDFVYRGQPDFGVFGLQTVEGRQQLDGGEWSIDRALQDTLAAVTKLDESGFRGPYALALAPSLYNGLFRLYPGSDTLQLEHLRRLCTRGIYKAPIEGGVLVDAPRVGVLIMGQDLRSGYIGQDGVHYELYLTESLVLRIDDPKAICTISARSEATSSGEAPRSGRRAGASG
jgi:uncharacterized linocin/CFP29 family protein